jgi:hypothetical protein
MFVQVLVPLLVIGVCAVACSVMLLLRRAR